MLSHAYTFIPNDPDDLHCLQSTVRMGWEGLFGTALSHDEAERVTNFEPGRQTWPFAAMLAVGDAGAYVVNVEDFDTENFIADPATELRRQTGDEAVVEHILAVSDAGAEVEIVKACLAHPKVRFENRQPGLPDLIAATQAPSTAVICNVNYRALVGRPGYNGHFVLVDSASPEAVAFQDPGLPPLKNHKVDAQTFLAAWAPPVSNMANMIACSIEPSAE
jgi:hypothetical protein